mgnify:CR=1 FL=1|tara:strand:- start:424 stop:1368 length:945 start_codon:yes stop_codon:yes gene_type:complete
MKRKAVIISVASTKLNSLEKKLISHERPWGIILFKRNINSLKQTSKLIDDIRKYAKDSNFPILIDEEGGEVSRLRKIINNHRSQNFFGEIYKKDKKLSFTLYKEYLLSIINILKKLKININTVPVLDLISKNSHRIITNRSYGNNLKTIKDLSNICIDIYNKNQIATVIKHIPGHGQANADSHLKLPIIKKRLNFLINKDFKCFKRKKSFFAMTAHILFNKIDKKNCVTHSKKIIKEIIRKRIGFKGILISDDISMKALKFDLLTNAKKSLNAGCNLVLYCSGKAKVSQKLLQNLPYIDRFTQKKTYQFYRFLR